jgi:hypothetical protein
MSVHITTQATVITETGELKLARLLYDNLGRAATISASTEAAGFPAQALAYPDTVAYWLPTALPAWVKWDFGSAISINAFGMAAHSLGLNNCTLQIQYSANDADWSNASDAHSIEHDEAALLLFPAQSARYWRAYITGAGDEPYIAVAYIGNPLVMPRPIYGGISPPNLSRVTEYTADESEGGQFVSQAIKRKGFIGRVSYKHLSASWYRDSFDPFVRHARLYPYFYAWRPGSFPDEVIYARTIEDIHPSNMGLRGLMEVNWTMKAHSNE